MIEIPLTALPHQRFSITLGDQDCVITLRQMGDYLFASAVVDQEEAFSEQLCCDRQLVPDFATTAFAGHLVFIDTLGKEHPTYTGIGTRFKLFYLADGEAWP